MNPSTNQKELNPEELAAILKKPEGEQGIKVAEILNETNIHITNFTYDSMDFADGQTILEIGFGNGKLMSGLVDKTKSLKVVGVDFSKDMVAQGQKILKEYIDRGQIELITASVEKLPFDDNYFDSVCTINCLYFWPDDMACCREAHRVLKPDGSIYIGIRSREEAQKIPTTQFGFTLYNDTEAIQLLENAGFKKVQIKRQTDPPVEFGGEIKIFDSWVVIGTK